MSFHDNSFAKMDTAPWVMNECETILSTIWLTMTELWVYSECQRLNFLPSLLSSVFFLFSQEEWMMNSDVLLIPVYSKLEYNQVAFLLVCWLLLLCCWWTVIINVADVSARHSVLYYCIIHTADCWWLRSYYQS